MAATNLPARHVSARCRKPEEWPGPRHHAHPPVPLGPARAFYEAALVAGVGPGL